MRRLFVVLAVGTLLSVVAAGSAGASVGWRVRWQRRCPNHPLLGVHDPQRLKVLGTCRWYKGTVRNFFTSSDGDIHVNVRPAPGFGHFLNKVNRRRLGGVLVVEIVPGQPKLRHRLPRIGEKVGLFGTWVLDKNHGWREMHPVWGISYPHRHLRLFDIPTS